jgi:undecaprenyl-diphosphatase
VVFEVAVHLGTLLAVVAYFRQDLRRVIVQFFRGGPGRLLGLQLLAATAITAAVGFTFEDFFASRFSQPRWALGGLLATSAVLSLAELVRRRHPRPLEQVRWRDVLAVGLMQAVAILPGVSRSGSTIAGGIFSGLTRDGAARFSFLVSVPTIAGVGLVQAKDIAAVPGEMALPLMAGTLVAALSGYGAIALLLAQLRRGRLTPFIVYTAVVGVAGLIVLG